jgi:hypothetical protein
VAIKKATALVHAKARHEVLFIIDRPSPIHGIVGLADRSNADVAGEARCMITILIWPASALFLRMQLSSLAAPLRTPSMKTAL